MGLYVPLLGYPLPQRFRPPAAERDWSLCPPVIRVKRYDDERRSPERLLFPSYRSKAASPLSAKQRLIGFGRFAPKPVLPGHEASFPKQTLARCAPFGPECRLGGGEQSK